MAPRRPAQKRHAPGRTPPALCGPASAEPVPAVPPWPRLARNGPRAPTRIASPPSRSAPGKQEMHGIHAGGAARLNGSDLEPQRMRRHRAHRRTKYDFPIGPGRLLTMKQKLESGTRRWAAISLMLSGTLSLANTASVLSATDFFGPVSTPTGPTPRTLTSPRRLSRAPPRPGPFGRRASGKAPSGPQSPAPLSRSPPDRGARVSGGAADGGRGSMDPM